MTDTGPTAPAQTSQRDEAAVPAPRPAQVECIQYQVSVLIPAFNEADRIGRTIAAARRACGAQTAQIIVVDDGSTDDTSAVAANAGADLLLCQPNRGKGAALSAAVVRALADVLLLIDADLGDTAEEARLLLEPIAAGHADMTIAAFPQRPGRGGGVGMVVRLARWGIARLTGRTMQSPLSGQRGLRREVLTKTGGFAGGWGVEIALTVRALRAGFRVTEVPTQMDHRVTGRDVGSVLHRAAQFRAALGILLTLALEGSGRRSPPPRDGHPNG